MCSQKSADAMQQIDACLWLIITISSARWKARGDDTSVPRRGRPALSPVPLPLNTYDELSAGLHGELSRDSGFLSGFQAKESAESAETSNSLDLYRGEEGCFLSDFHALKA